MRDWLSHRVRIEPDEEALVHAATGDDYTFAHLDALVDDIAGRLVSLGVERGEHLGVVLSSRLEYVCLVHAAMRLGVTLVPMGDGLTPRELAGQIDTADVTTVVCGESTEGAVVGAVSRVGDASDTDSEGDPGTDSEGGADTDFEDIDGDADNADDGDETDADDADRPESVDADGSDSVDAAESDSVDAPDSVAVLTVDEPRSDVAESLDEASIEPVTSAEWTLDDTQLVLFTSGTTGDPKAVRLTTRNILSSAVASVFRIGFDPTDRWLVTLSLHHMGGIAPVLRMPLYGMPVVFREEFDPGSTADDIDRYDATAVSLVPTMLRRMLDRRGTLSESLRVVLLGGAPASPELIERCRDYSVPVHPTYGMTETASQIATARPAAAFENPETVGRPLFLTSVTVVDEEGAPLPAGEPGELVVDGPTVTPGYYGDEAATAEAFGEYGLHTGDVGVVDERGSIAVLNRLDDRIVTGGENVHPGEVVDVLVSHPDVREAAVVGVPDAEWGERVSALVVADRRGEDRGPTEDASGGPPIDRSEVLDFAREQLADFKLPKTIAFADSLPRTVSGTVDRERVRETFTGGGSPAASAGRRRGDFNRSGGSDVDDGDRGGDEVGDESPDSDFEFGAGADADVESDSDRDAETETDSNPQTETDSDVDTGSDAGANGE